MKTKLLDYSYDLYKLSFTEIVKLLFGVRIKKMATIITPYRWVRDYDSAVKLKCNG